MSLNLAAAALGGCILVGIILLGSTPTAELGTAGDVQLRLLARTAVPTFLLIGAAALLRTVLGAGLGLLRVAVGPAAALGGLLTVPSVLPEVVLGFVAFWAFFAPLSPTAWLVALTLPGVLHVAIDVRTRSNVMLAQPWIESAVAIGTDRRGLLMRHLLPNLRPVLVALFPTQAAASVVLLGELVLVIAYIGQGTSLAGIQILSGLQANYLPTWGRALPPALRAISQGDLQVLLIPVAAFAALLTVFSAAAALLQVGDARGGMRAS
jgi:ABC-type dipeptide/oligopeptide/nickel transport system permease subunit